MDHLMVRIFSVNHFLFVVAFHGFWWRFGGFVLGEKKVEISTEKSRESKDFRRKAKRESRNLK